MPEARNKKIFLDIKRPANKEPAPKIVIERVSGNETPPVAEKTLPRKKYLRVALIVLGVTLASLIGISALGLMNLKNAVTESAPSIYLGLKDAGRALENLETAKAKESFENAGEKINSLKALTEKPSLAGLAGLWSAAVPKFKQFEDAVGTLAKFTKSAIDFSDRLENIKTNGFGWLMNREAASLVENADKARLDLTSILALNSSIRNQGVAFGYKTTDEFLSLNVNLNNAEKFLASATGWLKRPEEKHLLVLFQNPSEMRPGGGFIGSYADAILNPAGLKEIKVWDIYDPDGQLDLKIIPPKQLQGITTTWGARDANWFFDFPTSAQKVIKMLESSKIYTERGIRFDGAIAINVEVIRTVLDVLGPIKLPEYDTVFTGENFLARVQEEVESGADNKAGEPKRILKILAPVLFQKLGDLNPAEKNALFEATKNHLNKKDIMIYFKDWNIETYLQNFGFTGEVMNLPDNFRGDYLAVVGANVAGGKSDAFITQNIRLSSKIDADGKIDDYLTIERTHSGDKKNEPWYRATNKSYIKIFTPRGSRLLYATGNDQKTIRPSADYSDTNFLTDPDLQAIEETSKNIKEFGVDELEETDKQVFGLWQNLKAGSFKKLELQYSGPTRLILGGKKIKYQFVFEKQSGSKTALDFIIQAPPGYVWGENGETAFNYVSADPNAREIIDLTLVPSLPASLPRP